MEFYTESNTGPFVGDLKVSIPNGMEFYRAERCLPYARSPFQFPTGWNSTNPQQVESVENTKVSIPNGMEFYNLKMNQKYVEFEFQFPTGWNSTLGMAWGIAIGSSFNSQRDGILLQIKYFIFQHLRFNSQRDGILRKPLRARL